MTLTPDDIIAEGKRIYALALSLEGATALTIGNALIEERSKARQEAFARAAEIFSQTYEAPHD